MFAHIQNRSSRALSYGTNNATPPRVNYGTLPLPSRRPRAGTATAVSDDSEGTPSRRPSTLSAAPADRPTSPDDYSCTPLLAPPQSASATVGARVHDNDPTAQLVDAGSSATTTADVTASVHGAADLTPNGSATSSATASGAASATAVSTAGGGGASGADRGPHNRRRVVNAHLQLPTPMVRSSTESSLVSPTAGPPPPHLRGVPPTPGRVSSLVPVMATPALAAAAALRVAAAATAGDTSNGHGVGAGDHSQDGDTGSGGAGLLCTTPAKGGSSSHDDDGNSGVDEPGGSIISVPGIVLDPSDVAGSLWVMEGYLKHLATAVSSLARAAGEQQARVSQSVVGPGSSLPRSRAGTGSGLP